MPGLNEVPIHWDYGPLRRFVPNVSVGIVVTPARYYVPSGVPCLRGLNISSGAIDSDDLVYLTTEANRLHRKSMLHAGDIVLVRTGRTGIPAVVPAAYEGANCVDLLIVRRSGRFLPGFLWYFLQSHAATEQAALNSEGALQSHYNTETLSRTLTIVPPIAEQQQIVAYLDKTLGDISKAVEALRSAIVILKRYRSALTMHRLGAAVGEEMSV